MTGIVLVLGAGATLAEHLARLPNSGRDSTPPPLDLSFFRTLQELESSMGCRSGLADRLERHLGVADIKQEGMEDVFGALWADSPRGTTSPVVETEDERDQHPVTLFDELVTAYVSMLALTTNHLVENVVAGALYPMIQRLFDASEGDLSIVSFNQDLVAEAALYALGQARGIPWDLAKSYSLPFLRTTNQHRSPEEPDVYKSYDRNALGVPLLKLHGSANWHVEDPFENRKIDPASGKIVPIEPEAGISLPNLRAQYVMADEAEVLCVQNRDLPEIAGITLDKEDRLMKILPVVVPPIFEKGEWIEGWLAPAWQQAANALGRARRIVFWGYSLPAADHRASLLFRRSLAGRDTAPRVSLVNPDIGLARRYWEAIRLPSIEQFCDQDAFASAP